MEHPKIIVMSIVVFGLMAVSTSAQEFGPEARNSYVVKFLDPNGPLPEIGGDFDYGWAATLNDGTNWLEFTDPENDQDPVNGPRTDAFHFYAGIVNGDPPRLYVGIIGTGFTPGVADPPPTENDEASWWGSALYEFLLLQNYQEDPRNKIALGYDGHWSDFQRNPSLTPAEFNLTNLEVGFPEIENGYAVEFAFDLDDVAYIVLDDPDPETGITWLRTIVSIQGAGAPLVVWPDGDFNGNVTYITHGSTGWDHMGWWDVTTEQDNPILWQEGSPVLDWTLY